MSREVLNCPFRQDVQSSGAGETAVCGFVKRLTDGSSDSCRVHRSACEACAKQAPLASPDTNPVIASLVLGVCEIDFPNADDSTPQGLLRQWAESSIQNEGFDFVVPWTSACDAIVNCRAGHRVDDARMAINSMLAQQDVFVLVHVIADQQTIIELADFADHANVRLHVKRHASNAWRDVQDLLPQLAKPFIAFAEPGTRSDPNRLCRATELLSRNGSEFLFARVRSATHVDDDVPEEDCDTPNWESLVARRHSILDSGGFRWWLPNAEVDWLYKAIEGKHKVRVDQTVSVETFAKPSFARHHQLPSSFPLTIHSVDRATHRCDVVLPFRDSLDFVRESMGGLLTQSSSDFLIHLVDDDSRECTDSFFRQYEHIPNVRFYRNSRNLGPFVSFNNIAALSQAEFIAVQDADDISTPDRIAESCHRLAVAKADLFGARTELFGDDNLVTAMAHETRIGNEGCSKYFRISRYPCKDESSYFLENPTLVVRVDTFRRLGGYGDFGESNRNRTGVDTDFQLRAYYGGASIMITHDIHVRYRCHGRSATNHADSGIGSLANRQSHAQVRERLQRYRSTRFDPRWFGAIDQANGMTLRIALDCD